VISMMASKMTDRPAIATRSLGFSLRGTGLSAGSLLVLPILERVQRPTQAPAVVAAAKACSAFGDAAAPNGAGAGSATVAFAANGSGNANAYGHQKTTQHGKWAFRGLEPWRDPA
jgi:hypothetical protein